MVQQNEELLKRIAKLVKQNQDLAEQHDKLSREHEKLLAKLENLKIIVAKIKDKGDLPDEKELERPRSLKFNMATVLFANIHGFSRISEGMDSEKLLDEMGSTKNAFGIQKNLVEDKKEEEEVLKAQLEQERVNLDVYKADLDRQKKDKEELLSITQNDEDKYQTLLAQAQSELAALQLAINLPEGDGEDVDKGDVIGLMGNTGCSSGPHLHFGLSVANARVDPIQWTKFNMIK